MKKMGWGPKLNERKEEEEEEEDRERTRRRNKAEHRPAFISLCFLATDHLMLTS